MTTGTDKYHSYSSSIGLKEWAAVCLALKQGKQSLLLRKGGIQEKGNQFQIDHPEFWLVPTRFHQSSEEIIPEEHDLLEICSEQKPKEGEIVLSEYAVVEEVHFIQDVDKLSRVKEFCIVSEETLANRFYYRSPGIYAIIIRTYQLENPIMISDEPSYEGCKSWIEFPEAFVGTKMKPVLDDDSYLSLIERIRGSLNGISDSLSS
jgi:hypothetical protein